jgi:hypothetical protein
LIPPGDRQDGDLDVFERRLDVYKQGGGLETETTYKRVFCVKADVLLIMPPATAVAPPRQAPRKKGRPTDKDRVITEAKNRMKVKTYPSIQALARELHGWLSKLPDAIRGVKNSNVMDVETIHDHIAPLFSKR